MLNPFRKKAREDCLKEIQVSEESRQILESPLVREFFQKAEQVVIDRWKSTPDDAVEARERLFVINGLLKNFRQHFECYIVNGQFAEKQLEEMVKSEK